MMNTPLLLSSAGMEFSWLAGFIYMILRLSWGFSLSIFELIFIFSLAAVITGISCNKGWFVIQSLLLQIMGVFIALLILLHRYYYPHDCIYRIDLALGVFTELKGLEEGFYLLVLLISVFFLWIGGVKFARRPRGYNDISKSFDKGISFFAIMFLIEGLITKTSSELGVWLALYFIFSLLAIGIARGGSGGEKEYISGYSKIGLIIGFGLIVAFIEIIIILFGISYMKGIADTAFIIIKNMTRPLLPVFISILKFLYGGRSISVNGSYLSSSNSAETLTIQSQGNNFMSLIEMIAGHLFFIVVIFIGVFLLALVLRNVFFWLFSRMDNTGNGFSFKVYLYRFYYVLKKIFIELRAKRKQSRVIQIYHKLCIWGRIAGLAKLPVETPREYSRHLADNFPAIAREIEIIVELYNREIYGMKMLTGEEINSTKISWKKICNPGNLLYLLKFRLNFL
jgi:hypothetical protein